MKNAASRAKFELASGTNQEGKINAILRYLTEFSDEDEGVPDNFFNVYVQKFVSENSIKKIPEKKTYAEVASISKAETLTAEERTLKKQLLLDKQMARIYRKKIEDFVLEYLGEKDFIFASDIPINTRKDFETLIYIRLFAIESYVYKVKKTEQRIRTKNCEFTDFEIIKRKQEGKKNV